MEFAEIKEPQRHVRICSDHFERNCYCKITPPKPLLTPEAVPTIPPICRKNCTVNGSDIASDENEMTMRRPALQGIYYKL